MTGSSMSARSRVLAPVVAVAATAVVVVVGVLVPQATPASGGPTVEVQPRTTTICATHPDDERGPTLVAGAVAEGTGELTLADLARQRSVGDRLTDTGVVATEVEPGPYTVTATGGLTSTAAGVLLGSQDAGPDRGLSAQACALPGTEHWFVGLGAHEVQFSTVLVTNPDAQAAEVELRVHGPRGPVTAPGSSGIAVPPHATRAIPLEGMVSAEGPLAVEVRATAGRVGAVVQDRHRSGTQPAGADWIAAAGLPATDQVIPGVPGGAGDRDLVLVNPGERTATVRVDALTGSGSFTLKGADAVDVPPASTVRVPLADALEGEEAALRLVAEQPVTAALVATSERSDLAPDVAIAVPAEPIRSPAVLPVVAARDVTGRVLLSNPSADPVQAVVVLRDRSGEEVDRVEVEVAPGATAGVDAEGDGVWAEISTEGAVPLHVAVVLSSDRADTAGLAWLPGTSPRVGGELPSVARDPRVAR